MESHIRLETEVGYGQTRIKHVDFKAPYKITSPFYDGSHSDIMIMSASAGLLAGDSFRGEYVFGAGSDVTILSQSYEKVFNTEENQVTKKVSIWANEGSKVRFMPYPMIPFEGSRFVGETEIHVEETARILYCDIFSCGRTGMGEYYKMSKFHSKTTVYVGEKMAFLDNTLIEPTTFDYQVLGMWGDYTHNGMIYVYVPSKKEEDAFVERVRKEAKQSMDGCLVGVSRCLCGVVVRVLANGGEKIYRFVERI